MDAFHVSAAGNPAVLSAALFADTTRSVRRAEIWGEAGLNDTVLLPQPLFADPQKTGPAPSVKCFSVVITPRSPGPAVGGRSERPESRAIAGSSPHSTRTHALLGG